MPPDCDIRTPVSSMPMRANLPACRSYPRGPPPANSSCSERNACFACPRPTRQPSGAVNVLRGTDMMLSRPQIPKQVAFVGRQARHRSIRDRRPELCAARLRLPCRRRRRRSHPTMLRSDVSSFVLAASAHATDRPDVPRASLFVIVVCFASYSSATAKASVNTRSRHVRTIRASCQLEPSTRSWVVPITSYQAQHPCHTVTAAESGHTTVD